MTGNLHFSLPYLPWFDLKRFSSFWRDNEAQLFGKLLVEDAMKPDDKISSRHIKIRVFLKVCFKLLLATNMG